MRRSLPLSLALACSSMTLSGCGTINQMLAGEQEHYEMYQVFDIQTDEGIETVAEATSNGIQRNISGTLETALPIPPSETPSEPGRFEVTNPFEGTQVGALAGDTAQLQLSVVSCDGAVWTGEAERDVTGAQTQVHGCLWEYEEGYHLDLYMQILDEDQGLIAGAVTEGVEGIVGNPREWAEQIAVETTETIDQDIEDAEITHIEGRPAELEGAPWIMQETR